MKLPAFLTATVAAGLTAIGPAHAASPDASNNPYSSLDPDGVPLAISQGQNTLSHDPTENSQQKADAIQRSRNWLLIDYEEEVQRRKAQAPGQDNTSNVYLDLSLNKDLAKLAGLTPLDTTTPVPPLHAAPDPVAQTSLSLRPAATPAGGAFTPIITPLSSPAASAATQPFYSNYASPLPNTFAPGTAFQPSLPGSPAPTPQPQSHPHTVSPVDTIDLQTPGMVADKDNPLTSTPDLTLDSLPDPNGDNAPASPDANQPPQLPELKQAMTVDQMHLALDSKLKVPNPVAARAALQAQQQPQQQNLKPAPASTEEQPTPISQQPQLSPVHAPLPSPFDILNH